VITVNEEEKIISRFSRNTPATEYKERIITDDELQGEYAYDLATKALKDVLAADLITSDEFNKIDTKNRESFSPHLAGLFPNNA
jgi:hypothetical protein